MWKISMIFEAVDRATKVMNTIMGASQKLAKAGSGNIVAGFRKVARGAALAGGIMASAYGGATLAAYQLTGTASEFERYQTVLETTEGSARKAEAAMGWVSEFAVKTPYELDQVTENFVKLRAYGIDPTNGVLKTLGDTSAAMGKPLTQSVEMMADAITGENERLKEFGIRASKAGGMITYEYTNAAGKMETASVKASDRMAIQAKLMEILSSKYGGAMEKLSRTWGGMMSNMADQWARFQLMIMQSGLFDWMKDKLSTILKTIDTMAANGQLEAWAKHIGQSIQHMLEQAWAFGTRFVEVLGNIHGYLDQAQQYVGGWENLLIILGAFTFAPAIMATATGIVQIASGLAMLATGGGGLLVIRSLGLAFRLASGSALLFGRAIMTVMGGGIWLLGAALKGTIAGIAALPRVAMAAAGGLKAMALAAIALPGRLLAVSRALIMMAVGSIRALPATLMGVARSFVLMSAAGLRALPGAIMAVSRGLLMLAVGSVASLPALLSSLGSAFMALGAAMMATPIGWIIAGIAGIAAGAYLIYQNWDKIGPFFTALWEGVKAKFQEFWNWIKSFELPLPDFGAWADKALGKLSAAFDKVTAFGGKAMDKVKNLFSWGDDAPVDPVKVAVSDPASIDRAVAAVGKLQAGLDKANATNLSGVSAEIARLTNEAKALTPAVQSAVSLANSYLAGQSFHQHGVRLMETMAAGIKAGAQAVVGAVRATMAEVRGLLPSSPARYGPLSDLDKLRFTETIAATIRPAPMVNAMRAAAAATLAAATLSTSAAAGYASYPGTPDIVPSAVASAGRFPGTPANAPEIKPRAPIASRPGGNAGSGGAAGRSGGPEFTINYSPQITLSGNAEHAKGEFAKLLKEHASEIEKIVKERMRLADRRKY